MSALAVHPHLRGALRGIARLLVTWFAVMVLVAVGAIADTLIGGPFAFQNLAWLYSGMIVYARHCASAA